jgi:hypothetical protein
MNRNKDNQKKRKYQILRRKAKQLKKRRMIRKSILYTKYRFFYYAKIVSIFSNFNYI